MLYKVCFLVLCITLVASCGNKKKTMAGEDEVNLQEFVDFFPETALPFTYADASLHAKPNDSLIISSDIYNKFTPDSTLAQQFSNVKPKLYAVGKFSDKDGVTYLLSKAITNKFSVLFITAYNKEQTFLASLPIVKSSKNKETSIIINIDNQYNINKRTVKKLPNGIEVSGDDVYALNNAAKKFMLIMTDAIGDQVTLVNPIDTLGKTYKYAGDYGVGKRNLISVRDDARSGRLQIFLHLEKNNAKCIGDLRGEAFITGDNTIEYRQAGDPCVLQFKFQKNKVTLKEISGCGSRMGALDCAFDGTYPKIKPQQVKE